jgi:Zn-dependent protease with chaperone function
MAAVKLEGLNPREYEHPLDKKTLDALERTAGLDVLVRKFNDLGAEQFLRLEFISSYLKITPGSFPDIYEILEEACDNLNLKTMPQFYLRPDDYFRKFEFSTNNLEGITVGVNSSVVVISTACIEFFSKTELLFILGCEIGRIKSQHILYQNIALILPLLSDAVAMAVFGINIAAPIINGVGLALTQWSRMADYTADRAGLLACQDVNSAMTAMAKIAGLPKRYFDSFNLDDFLTQVREFEGFTDTIHSKLIKVLSFAVKDQALTISRASELLRWIDSGSYQSVLERETKIQLPKFCRHCGFDLQGRFQIEVSNPRCPRCGKDVSV